MASASLVTACHGNSQTSPTGGHAAKAANNVYLPLDVGIAMLAEAENARVALALNDPVATANDILRARSFARQLPDQSSVLFPLSRSGPNGRASPFTAFRAQVKLTTAATLVETGQLAKADGPLAALVGGLPVRQRPATLLLLRARESLDLARIAVADGRKTELKTQLLTAQRALDLYPETADAADIRSMAATFGKVAGSADELARVTQGQAAIWRGLVDGWMQPFVVHPPAAPLV